MQKELKLTKKTAFIQILELVASVVMGYGLKTGYRGRGVMVSVYP